MTSSNYVYILPDFMTVFYGSKRYYLNPGDGKKYSQRMHDFLNYFPKNSQRQSMLRGFSRSLLLATFSPIVGQYEDFEKKVTDRTKEMLNCTKNQFQIVCFSLSSKVKAITVVFSSLYLILWQVVYATRILYPLQTLSEHLSSPCFHLSMDFVGSGRWTRGKQRKKNNVQ